MGSHTKKKKKWPLPSEKFGENPGEVKGFHFVVFWFRGSIVEEEKEKGVGALMKMRSGIKGCLLPFPSPS